MVEIYLSKKHTNYFYIRYSKDVTSADDDRILPLFKNFLATENDAVMVLEMAKGGIIIDKEWFQSTGLGRIDQRKILKKIIAFGYHGIQNSFIKVYFTKTAAVGIPGELLETLEEFEKKYNVDFSTFKSIDLPK